MVSTKASWRNIASSAYCMYADVYTADDAKVKHVTQVQED